MSDQTHHKTVLGADCRITGELSLDNDAVIMGQFKGTLRVRGLLELTESSHIAGTVVAGAVRLAGNAEADVVAEHGVEMLATASLSGQLFTSHLSVAEGAVFQGQVFVGPNALAAAERVLTDINLPASDDEAADQDEQEAPAQRAAALNLADDEAAEEAEEAATPVNTMPTSLDTILRRRRPKTLSASQPHRVAVGPKSTPQARAS
ncbi:MAG: polymer-forming cytoskeletal protein [Phycisphaeraceae bacterium]|nr:polymer-forming cytoskeletal protein [Phycisphaeraceae bacterium]